MANNLVFSRVLEMDSNITSMKYHHDSLIFINTQLVRSMLGVLLGFRNSRFGIGGTIRYPLSSQLESFFTMFLHRKKFGDKEDVVLEENQKTCI